MSVLAISVVGYQALLGLAGILVLLLLAGCMVACEFALVKLRYDPQAAKEAEAVQNKRLLKPLVENAERTARVLRFSRIGFTLAFGISLVPLLSHVLSLFGVEDQSRLWLIRILAFLLAVFAYTLFAELLARGIALRHPIRTLAFTSPVLLVIRILVWPLMAVISWLRIRLYGLFRLHVADDLNPLDVEVQIRALGEDTPILSKVVRSIINRSLAMQDLTVADILLPRNQVMIFDLEDPLEDNIELARKTGHTRFPLCEGDLDHCVGIIHIKDIFRFRGNLQRLDLERIKRPIVHFKESESLELAFQRMLRLKMHMALVRDEFSGVVGVITLERILEVLVGEIQDEFDFEELNILKLSSDRFRVSGLTAIHDLEETLGVVIENEDVATFGGLVTGELGHIPNVGERIQIGRMNILVKDVEETRLISADVTVLPLEDEESTD